MEQIKRMTEAMQLSCEQSVGCWEARAAQGLGGLAGTVKSTYRPWFVLFHLSTNSRPRPHGRDGGGVVADGDVSEQSVLLRWRRLVWRGRQYAVLISISACIPYFYQRLR